MSHLRARRVFGMGIRARCIFGGRDSRWRRAGQCCSRKLVDDPSSHLEEFPTDEAQEKRAQAPLRNQLSNSCSGKTRIMSKYLPRRARRF